MTVEGAIERASEKVRVLYERSCEMNIL